jgi:eukaryotic-like serine/threonine-protein kinase
MNAALTTGDLLFAAVAIRLQFIDRNVCVAAIDDPAAQPGHLSARLVRERLLTTDDAALICSVVGRHLDRHGHDAARSLAALSTAKAIDETVAFLRQRCLSQGLSVDGPPDSCDTLPPPSQGADTPANAGSAASQPATLAAAPMPAELTRGPEECDALSTQTHDPGDIRNAPASARPTKLSTQAALRFSIKRFHAQGGMGEVLLARDEELHRDVALKQLKPRFSNSDQSRARFVAEAEITGALEHPGIIPVYGLGAYPDGRPFYAMRFVHGTSFAEAIKQFQQSPRVGHQIRSKSLEFRRLLSRFLSVCGAIEFAHTRGIIHRDIKPQNIMLGDFGETLVVDWGLAKIVSVAPGEDSPKLSVSATVDETQMGMAVGTLQYMPPEQAAGRQDLMGAASDLYSLGATLYQLLTGRPPIVEASAQATLLAAQQGKYPLPRSLHSAIPRSAQAICSKALAFAPSDRYASARALADDVERWLADDRVSCFREGPIDKLFRWLRKHRAWARAIATTLLIVTIVSTTAAWLVNDARREEAQQRLAAERAQQQALTRFRQARDSVDKWLTAASMEMQYYPGMADIRRRLLQRAVDDYEHFATEQTDDALLELERARAYVRLGDVLLADGKGEPADQAFAKAVRLFAALKDDPLAGAAASGDHSEARVKQALTAARRGLLAQADEIYQSMFPALREAVAQQPGDRTARRTLAMALANAADLEQRRGSDDSAEQLLREALSTLESPQNELSEERSQDQLATTRAMLGQCLLDRGQTAAAAEQLAAAASGFRHLAELDDANLDYVQKAADTELSQATALRMLGRFAGELSTCRNAMVDYGRLEQALPGAARVLESKSTCRLALSQVLVQVGESGEARDECQKALETIAVFRRRAPDMPDYCVEEAVGQDQLAEILLARNDPQAALAAAESAEELFGRLTEAFPEVSGYRQRRAICRSRRAQALQQLGQVEKAGEEFRQAIDELQKEPDHLARDAACFAQIHLARWLAEQGDLAAAADTIAAARAERERLAETYDTPEYRQRLAWLLIVAPLPAARDAPAALRAAQASAAAAPDNPRYLATLAAAAYRGRDFVRAVEGLREARGLFANALPGDQFFLAMALWQTGDRPAALAAFDEAEAWRRERLPGLPELRALRDEAEHLIKPAAAAEPALRDEQKPAP